MKKNLTEEKVLKKLDIPDFRHLTKDKVIAFASLLPQMDPEVAQKALEQFPHFVETSLDIMKDYKDVIQSTLQNNADSTNACYDMYNRVMDSLEKLLDKDNLSFEEQTFILEQMKEVASEVNKKDSETKKYNLATMGAVASVALGIVAVVGSSLGINIGIKPKDL